MNAWNTLFYFTSPKFILVEVRRDDLDTTNPSEKYRWLALPVGAEHGLDLEFASMAEGHRRFRAGELHFGEVSGEFHLWGECHPLIRHPADSLPAQLAARVDRHLTTQSPCTDSWALRMLRPSDVEHFHLWVLDPEVVRFSMTQFHRMRDATDVTAWFSTTLQDRRTWQRAIADPASGALIGYAGLAAINEIDGNAEYFIFIGDKRFWGKGIASGVTREVVCAGFEELHLHRIFLTASSANTGALRAYAKAGFREEGRLREAFFRGGAHSDKVIMGQLRSEWDHSSASRSR